jgi:hypothetical protein
LSLGGGFKGSRRGYGGEEHYHAAMVEPGDRLYWDPVPHLDVVLGVSPGQAARSPKDLGFCGRWEERDWRNVPGRFTGR